MRLAVLLFLQQPMQRRAMSNKIEKKEEDISQYFLTEKDKEKLKKIKTGKENKPTVEDYNIL